MDALWDCLLLLWLLLTVADSCNFPEYLWNIPEEVTYRVWYSEAKFIRSSHTWESRKHILARNSELQLSMQYPWICESQPENDNRRGCVKKEPLYSLGCHRVEGNGKFRVRQTGDGYIRFSCIKFRQRNSNVVQFWFSNPSDTNEDRLCLDENLVHSEWPWLAEKQVTWSPCPVIGGFNFRTYINERKKKMCHRVWRPSRLETECVLGEGLQFSFPEKTCSFFYDRPREMALQCWAVWEEEWFTFIIAAEIGYTPQYVLRLPKKTHQNKMDVHLFFSPVCALNERGIPPGNVMHVELRLARGESGTCYDESPNCATFAKEGRCSNGNLHQYGNYCKRSCGLCELVPSSHPECDFPLHYQGEWLLFERDRKEDVRLSSGQLRFSRLGTFICKSKHWADNTYKFLSVYENGCRPRYTCIDFVYDEKENFLRFRISPSSKRDQSFELCNFQPDPEPVGDTIRSDQMKLLYPLARAQTNTCGLGGLVHLQAVSYDGRSCDASLSDWNPFSCSLTNKMALSFRACKTDDFVCEAYIDVSENYRILYTKEEMLDGTGERFSCWLIKVDNSTGINHGRWEQAFILRRTQCGLDGDFDHEIYKPAELSFQIRKDPVEKHCLVINKGSTPYSSTIRYTVRKTHGGKTSKGSKPTRRKPDGKATYAAMEKSTSSGKGAQLELHSRFLLYLYINTFLWLILQ